MLVICTLCTNSRIVCYIWYFVQTRPSSAQMRGAHCAVLKQTDHASQALHAPKYAACIIAMEDAQWTESSRT